MSFGMQRQVLVQIYNGSYSGGLCEECSVCTITTNGHSGSKVVSVMRDMLVKVWEEMECSMDISCDS
jgi:hypothetical protein